MYVCVCMYVCRYVRMYVCRYAYKCSPAIFPCRPLTLYSVSLDNNMSSETREERADQDSETSLQLYIHPCPSSPSERTESNA